jgi:hypothetical protein
LVKGLYELPAPSTTKTGRHDIAEILLKVALSTKKSTTKNHLTFSRHRKFSLPRGNGKMVDRIERFYLKRTINNLSSKLLLVLSC